MPSNLSHETMNTNFRPFVKNKSTLKYIIRAYNIGLHFSNYWIQIHFQYICIKFAFPTFLKYKAMQSAFLLVPQSTDRIYTVYYYTYTNPFDDDPQISFKESDFFNPVKVSLST